MAKNSAAADDEGADARSIERFVGSFSAGTGSCTVALDQVSDPSGLLSSLIAADKSDAPCSEAHAHAKMAKPARPGLYVVTGVPPPGEARDIEAGVYFAPWAVVSDIVGPIKGKPVGKPRVVRADDDSIEHASG